MGTFPCLTYLPVLLLTLFTAIGTAAFNQFRVLGGALTLSIVTAVGNNWVKAQLSGFLSDTDLGAVFASTSVIDTFPQDVEDLTRQKFAESFGLQTKILLGIAVASVFASCLMWQRVQIRIP